METNIIRKYFGSRYLITNKMFNYVNDDLEMTSPEEGDGIYSESDSESASDSNGDSNNKIFLLSLLYSL